jgi:AmmeMemoRadiSam system protein B/AmmeMemoRadiSam system protein A
MAAAHFARRRFQGFGSETGDLLMIVLPPDSYWLAAPLVALLVMTPFEQAFASGLAKVRAAAVAGSFYPADPKELAAMIDDLLAHASCPAVNEPILAAVAPHAGYQFSGPVAACTYAALKGRKISRVVLIAPSHYEGFQFSAVYDGDAYATPLGNVPVDKAFAHQLVKLSGTMRLSSQGHDLAKAGLGHDATKAGGEHSVEVQLPWLQRVLGNFELVPIIMGDQNYENSRALGVALAKLIRNESKDGKDNKSGETLVLASSDLSHFHPYNDAETIDHKTLNALASWDYYSMSRNFQTRTWEACGGAPIVAAMIYAERMGANLTQVLKYENSGDTTGDHSRVVGYSADVFVKAPVEKSTATPFSLTESEKSELLALARASVETMIQTKSPLDPPQSASQALNQGRGAFVTLREAGVLRGCIGYTSAIKPLTMAVRDTATLAAVQDPRFPPVTVAELPRLEYEISVLSPLRRVTNINQIKIGEHGLIMKNGDSEGLLLPQVPVEQKWDKKTFLEQTCVKAGLEKDCWKDEETDIFSFTALVFAEDKP